MGAPDGARDGTGRLGPARLAWPEVPRELRPQPIRDALLAYLVMPRLVGDIARHIERPIPTTTGHLAAMRRLGLVRRLGYGVYAVSAYEGPVPVRQPSRQELPQAVRSKVRAALRTPISFVDLVRRTGLPERDVRTAVHAFWMAGLIAGDEASSYRPMRALTNRRGEAGPPARARHATRREHAR